MTKWRTNNGKLRDIIGRKENIVNDSSVTSSEKKVLGIKWNEYTDMLIIDPNDFVPDEIFENVTKRKVLGVIASFYDPVGYIQPIIVQLKIFFQLICKEEYGWDEELTDELKKKWNMVIGSVKKAGKINVQRCYCVYDVNDPTESIQLIGFSDASEMAYGCCIYFRFVKKSGELKVVFVTSKSRIAPLNKNVSNCSAIIY